MKKLTTIILLFAMVLSMLVPVGAAEGAKLVMSGNNVANAQSVAAGVIGAVGAGADEADFKTSATEFDTWDGTKDATFYDKLVNRDITKENVFEVYTAEELYAWAQYRQDYKQNNDNGKVDPNKSADVTIVLKANLDLAGKAWRVLDGTATFAGKFDGGNHLIKGISLAYGSSNKGFFGNLVGNAEIKNVSLLGTVTVSRDSALNGLSTVIGNVTNAAGETIVVSNVYSGININLKSSHTGTAYQVAGIVARACGKGTLKIENCKYDGNISDAAAKVKFTQQVGGIVATIEDSQTLEITNCTVDSEIGVGACNVGGLIGHSTHSAAVIKVSGCKVLGKIQSSYTTANSPRIAGIIGYAQKSNSISISNCWVDAIVENTAAATADARVAAGVLGEATTNTLTITNCTVKGEITATTRTAGVIAVPNSIGTILISNCDIDVVLNANQGLAAGIYGNGNNQNGDVTVSNCKVAGKINASGATSAEYAVAGILCRVYTSKKAVNISIQNCEVAMDVVDAGNAPAAGVIGWLRASGATYNNVTVQDCSYTGSIKTKGHAGGMIAHVPPSLQGALTVSDCYVGNGTIEGGDGSGGVLGQIDAVIAKGLVVKNCAVDANVTGTNNCGGVVGYIKGTAKGTSITVLNCSYSGHFTGTGYSNGGIAGNIDTNTSEVVVKHCLVDGVVESNRSSGGFIGYATAKNFACEDIQVTGTVDITAGQNHNNRVGGMIGILNVTTATLKDVVFSGSFRATLAPVVPSTRNPLCYAGGLIGYISNAASVVRLDNCHVNGALHFEEANSDAFVNIKGLGIFIGGAENSTSARPNVIYGQNVNYNLKALANATGHDVTLVGEGVPSMGNTAVLGYQIKWNKDNTYDLRYIMGMKDVYDSIGVQAEIRYNFGEGVNVRYENVKVENVYKEVVDGESNTYRAADFAMDYLYTLTITNIPKEYAVHAGDLQVALIPYGKSNDVTEFGVTTVQGDMGGFVELEDSDFGKEKPEAIDNALIHIYAGDYNVEETVKPATATATEVSGGKNVRHWYTNANTVLLYNFTVEEEGWYDAYFYLRLKNESVRSNQIVISNGETTETFTLFYVATSTHTGLKDSTNGTYLSEAFEIYLTPGEYTLTILPGWTGGASSGSLHYRDIYFVK